MFMLKQLPLALAAIVFTAPTWAGIAEIVSLTGNGDFRPDTNAQWQPARVKQALDAGNFVRTGDLSSMAILFTDRTQMRLSQNSMFQLKGSDPKSGDTTLQLRQGRAWTQAKPAGDKPAGWSQSSATGGRLLMETPSAIGAIHGTDWEMEVDALGRTRLTVLHGEVEFYNEHGRVVVRSREQALAEPGKAPVKMFLQNPAERVQWVTAFTVEARHYDELRAGTASPVPLWREIAALLGEQRLAEARSRLAGEVQGTQATKPAVWLLLADLEILAGNLDQAVLHLQHGARQYPEDMRLPARLARIALLRDHADEARRILESAMARFPESAELRLMQGELARFDGDARSARNAYTAATTRKADDYRGWLGLGITNSERDNKRAARAFLDKALALAPAATAARGELATLETMADNLATARLHFESALRERPDDYVALTGFGLLQLKSGQTEQALDTLLRATVLEPRYARAVIYTAVAYYQLGRTEVALETLARASELDGRDPLPHQLASLILGDQVRYSEAIDSAREALRRLPYLKSLDQVANNQKGAANLGNALAQSGLEDWALNYAHASYDSFWAGSHLFLADRYSGPYAKQSELMQGYLTDPTLFGASNRWQTLLPRPGDYVSVGATGTRSSASTLTAPSFTLNGYANSQFPVAYFVEGMRINAIPGSTVEDGHGNNLTAALGLRPRDDISLFLFANSLDARVLSGTAGQPASLTDGHTTRFDLGARYRHDRDNQTWLKLGFGEGKLSQSASDRRFGQAIDYLARLRPQSDDQQFRHTLRLDEHELSVGFELATRKLEQGLATTIAVPRFGGGTQITTVARNDRDRDRSEQVYASALWRVWPGLTLDTGLYQQAFAKRTQTTEAGYTSRETHRREGLNPRLGLAWVPAPGETWRLAYQKWWRPVSPNGLAPTATAGIVLDDQMTLPDGELRRWRLQFEKEWSADTFTSAFYDRRRIVNLGAPGAVLNQVADTADLDRLRNRAALVFQANGEALEETPVFARGRAELAGVALNQRWTRQWSAFAAYVHGEARNEAPGLQRLRLPYLPRHRLTLGANWAGPERLLVQAAAVYRSRRFADEANQVALPAGWDLAAKLNWTSADKRWLTEAYATNLLKRHTAPILGLNVVWRY